jgi:integrase
MRQEADTMSIHKRVTKRRVVYDVRLRTPEGRPYSRTFATKRAAETFEAGERAARARGVWIDPRAGAVTFAEWADEWCRSTALGKRPKTREVDESTIRGYLLPAFGMRPLNAITPRDVQAWVTQNTEGYAATSVHRRYGVLRAIMRAAVSADLIGRTPCRGIKLPPYKAAPKRLPTSEDLRRLANTIDPMYSALVPTLAETGLRIGEAFGLQVSDLDLLRGELAVRRTVVELSGGGLVIGEPKTRAGSRTLALSRPLCAILSEHLARRGLSAANAEAWVFSAPQGGPCAYRSWRSRFWAPAIKRLGLDGLSPHRLRDFAATSWVGAGIDLRTAQHRLGHATPRLVLEVYAHATTDGDRAAAEKLAALLYTDDNTDVGARAMDAR